MIYTTLNEIREYKPCLDEWEKLLNGLNKTSADNGKLSFKQILDICGIKYEANFGNSSLIDIEHSILR